MEWYLKVLKQYADFNGRARRKEYWMFVLFNFLFVFAAFSLDMILGSANQTLGVGLIVGFYNLFVLIPSLAVAVRRLHDLGKSGWMLLVSFIPLVGGIWLLILFLTEGNPSANKYGENPKAHAF